MTALFRFFKVIGSFNADFLAYVKDLEARIAALESAPPVVPKPPDLTPLLQEIADLKLQLQQKAPTAQQIGDINDILDYANTMRSQMREQLNLFIAARSPSKL